MTYVTILKTVEATQYCAVFQSKNGGTYNDIRNCIEFFETTPSCVA